MQEKRHVHTYNCYNTNFVLAVYRLHGYSWMIATITTFHILAIYVAISNKIKC